MTNTPMRRGALCLALFAALSLGGAQHPQAKAQSEQSQAGAIQSGASQVANAVREIRPEKDDGCPDGKDKRGSDLCAEWSAVDAARDVAYATWAAVFLSFFGTVLIALTFSETRKATRRQLRAYLTVSTVDPSELASGKNFSVNVVCYNRGQTPARNVSVAAFAGMRKKPPSEADFAPISTDEELSVIDVGAGEPIRFAPDLGVVSQQHFNAYRAGLIGIYAWGVLEYRDIFNKRHKTLFRSELVNGAFSPTTKGNKSD